MPKKREIEVYEFNELSDEAKKRAIEHYRPHAWISHDSGWLSDQFKMDLETLGLPNEDVRWSLGYSQGDGVAFYGLIDLKAYLAAPMTAYGKEGRTGAKSWSPRGGVSEKRKFLPLVGKVDLTLKKDNPHYDHWNSMGLYEDVNEDLSPAEDALLNKLMEFVNKHIKDVSKEMEKIGYSEIEYQTSDEAIGDFLQANEFEFDEDGDRI